MTDGATPRLRVAYVDHVGVMSGGEIALVRLIAAMPDVDAHVILAEDGPLVVALQRVGATVHVLPINSGVRTVRREKAIAALGSPTLMLRLLRYIWQLRRLLRQLDPDVVHTNSLKAAIYGGIAGRLAGLPVIWHVRDRIETDYLPRPVVVLVRTLAWVVPHRIIANSQATLSTVRTSGSVEVNAVVVDALRAPRKEPPFERSASASFRIGMVGRISPWKGQDVFLRAIAELQDADLEAWVIGAPLFDEDGYETELRQLALDLGVSGQMVWRGFQSDVGRELVQLDVLVHASTAPEPFGQVIVEGMAVGLPVVASAAGGPLEIIEDGVDGFLTPPGDPVALAAVIRRLLDDQGLRRSIGAAAVVSSSRYHPEQVRARMLGLYSDLVGVRRRPHRS